MYGSVEFGLILFIRKYECLEFIRILNKTANVKKILKTATFEKKVKWQKNRDG